jgi:hypothetical protein
LPRGRFGYGRKRRAPAASRSPPVGDEREEQIVGVEPDAAEHRLRRDEAHRIELFQDERYEAVSDRHYDADSIAAVARPPS